QFSSLSLSTRFAGWKARRGIKAAGLEYTRSLVIANVEAKHRDSHSRSGRKANPEHHRRESGSGATAPRPLAPLPEMGERSDGRRTSRRAPAPNDPGGGRGRV